MLVFSLGVLHRMLVFSLGCDIVWWSSPRCATSYAGLLLGVLHRMLVSNWGAKSYAGLLLGVLHRMVVFS
ncbi:hypothetical protein DPMN_065045 [Dreissena polymorpha]|uniref:Uncharacterized protein n=1 Tax=Dreissena polymorpha TaxID=45954 RepID=A0A9D4CEA2_DREPO|nr:hypothetical protein DPMN_065045 [Dreissena polymorpha]